MSYVAKLPAPTGPCPLGIRTLQLEDTTRRDPWDNSPTRKLVVSVFYPARTVRGYPLAHQMAPQAAGFFGTFDATVLHPLPKQGVDWAATLTHSHVDAPPAPGRRPVLLYTPGGADPRTLGTGLAEELASHGYVVVSIDHPGETSSVEYPDGNFRPIELTSSPTDPVLFRKLMTVRLADIAFVLRQLPNLPVEVDPRRIGIYGHSAGGATAAQALDENPQLRAAVNLEGYLDYVEGDLFPIAQHGTKKPLLLAGTDAYRNERFDRTWSALLAHGGPVRRTELRDANHWVFTDFAAMAPQFQRAGLMSAGDRAALVGTIDPSRATPLVRSTVRSFFDRQLC
jgi:dienelactone hydrolase